MLTIINYGSGNISAISNVYVQLNIPFRIAKRPEDLNDASHIIIPGVGEFDTTMQLLNESGFSEKIKTKSTEEKTPTMGICVGLHVMAESSEEGKMAGLGLIEGKVRKIDASSIQKQLRLPHMGWNSITPKVNHPILEVLDFALGFYFLHSYHFDCRFSENILCETFYGKTFTSAVIKENIFGFQFHPEKGYENGARLFLNFYKQQKC